MCFCNSCENYVSAFRLIDSGILMLNWGYCMEMKAHEKILEGFSCEKWIKKLNPIERLNKLYCCEENFPSGKYYAIMRTIIYDMDKTDS